MKERPILFSAPMVRALLDGSKTQTRRVVKPQPEWLPEVRRTESAGSMFWPIGALGQQCGMPIVNCPYGQPGDSLWVREAIRLVPDQEPDDGTGRVLSTYGADGSPTVADAWPWKRSYLPPMHCPRGLSRIDLDVTGVRVERLQDISLRDVRAEGCEVREFWLYGGNAEQRQQVGANVYRALWEQINGAGSWAANPWVWVVEFKRIES